MRFLTRIFCLAGAFLTAQSLWAGGSGFNVAVVLNSNSTNSLQLANAYCEARGVPPQNVVRLNHPWSGGSNTCSLAEFQDYLLTPLLSQRQIKA